MFLISPTGESVIQRYEASAERSGAAKSGYVFEQRSRRDQIFMRQYLHNFHRAAC